MRCKGEAAPDPLAALSAEARRIGRALNAARRIGASSRNTDTDRSRDGSASPGTECSNAEAAAAMRANLDGAPCKAPEHPDAAARPDVAGARVRDAKERSSKLGRRETTRRESRVPSVSSGRSSHALSRAQLNRSGFLRRRRWRRRSTSRPGPRSAPAGPWPRVSLTTTRCPARRSRIRRDRRQAGTTWICLHAEAVVGLHPLKPPPDRSCGDRPRRAG